jgi:hypothetical protein
MRFIADGIVPGLWFGEHEHEYEMGRGFSTTDGHGRTRMEQVCFVWEGEVPSEPQVRVRFVADGIVPGLWFGEYEYEYEYGGGARMEWGCW